jgi:hypothetical protein
MLKKICLLLLVLLSFSCGWWMSDKYTRCFRFWLYEPEYAEYIGWDKDKRRFIFKIEDSMRQGIVYCSYENLGVNDDTAHISDSILTLNQKNIAISKYANINAVNVYIYASPPLPLNFILPVLLGTPGSRPNISWLPSPLDLPLNENNK